MVAIFITSAKMATPGLLKILIFLNEGYDLIIYIHDVTNRILSRDLNHIVDAAMRQRFRNSSTFMREVIKLVNNLGWFNNLGLALGTNWIFYASVSKGLKLYVKKFWELIYTFVKVTGEKLIVRGTFWLLHPE